MADSKAAGKEQPEAYPLGYVEDCFVPENAASLPFSASRHHQRLRRCLINPRSQPRKLTIGISLE